MKKPDGTAKGCAFVKYQHLESCLLAIKALNTQAYLLNSSMPIEVRFAENKKKTQQNNAQVGSKVEFNNMAFGQAFNPAMFGIFCLYVISAKVDL